MEIKFNKVKDLSDARYASAMMAQWVGFEMFGPDALPIASIQEIVGWINGPQLILELNTKETVTESRLLSWMDVLPVKGFECNPVTFKAFSEKDEFRNLIWLITETTDQTGSDVFTHSPELTLNSPERHIVKLTLNEQYDKSVLENYKGISIDCEPAENPALKNYEYWNNFFEELELI